VDLVDSPLQLTDRRLKKVAIQHIAVQFAVSGSDVDKDLIVGGSQPLHLLGIELHVLHPHRKRITCFVLQVGQADLSRSDGVRKFDTHPNRFLMRFQVLPSELVELNIQREVRSFNLFLGGKARLAGSKNRG
jgi:hypothetical protein